MTGVSPEPLEPYSEDEHGGIDAAYRSAGPREGEQEELEEALQQVHAILAVTLERLAEELEKDSLAEARGQKGEDG